MTMDWVNHKYMFRFDIWQQFQNFCFFYAMLKKALNSFQPNH